jgi:hypothetical protein
LEYKRSRLEEWADIVLWQTWVMIENYCAIHESGWQQGCRRLRGIAGDFRHRRSFCAKANYNAKYRCIATGFVEPSKRTMGKINRDSHVQ